MLAWFSLVVGCSICVCWLCWMVTLCLLGLICLVCWFVAVCLGDLFIRRLGLECWYSVFDTWFGLLEFWLL